MCVISSLDKEVGGKGKGAWFQVWIKPKLFPRLYNYYTSPPPPPTPTPDHWNSEVKVCDFESGSSRSFSADSTFIFPLINGNGPTLTNKAFDSCCYCWMRGIMHCKSRCLFSPPIFTTPSSATIQFLAAKSR